MKSNLLLLIVFFVYTQCSRDTGSVKKIINKKYDANKNLISEQEFLKVDTGLMADGYCKQYYNNGGIKSLCFYKNGKHDSIMYYYYENGCIDSKLHLFNDTPTGSAVLYYSNCKIKSFMYFTNSKSERFVLNYDSITSRPSEVRGHPLTFAIANKKTKYSISDTIILSSVVTIPDRIVDTLFIKIAGKYGIYIDTVTKFDYFKSLDLYYFDFPYACELGSAKYTAVLNLYDSISNKLLVTDTFSYKIDVK